MPSSSHALPYQTADLPGCGGVLRERDDDFVVEEIPAYEPEGSGDHVFALVEKRGLTTMDMCRSLAGGLDIRPQDIGTAGLKDRHAVTRQLCSLPPPISPEAVLAVDIPGVTILSAIRHPHKLRTGHLRGNRFTITLREVDCDADLAAERARAILDRLESGLANFFGEQRFGRDRDNAVVGRALVAGTPLPAGMKMPRQQRKRLLISAFQSDLFNSYLSERIADGLFAQVIDGDLLQKTDSGGIFPSAEPAIDQARLDRGELVITGPMYGHKMKVAPAGSSAGIREATQLANAELTLESFKRVGKLARGTRRPLAVSLGPTRVRVTGERTIEFSFALPSGSYATVVMREIVKAESPAGE